MVVRSLKDIEAQKLNEKIDKAKKIARKEYVNFMKSIDAHNPNYKRLWRKIVLENGNIAFALNGTPDKAFVLVEKDTNKVTALRTDMSVIGEF